MKDLTKEDFDRFEEGLRQADQDLLKMEVELQVENPPGQELSDPDRARKVAGFKVKEASIAVKKALSRVQEARAAMGF